MSAYRYALSDFIQSDLLWFVLHALGRDIVIPGAFCILCYSLIGNPPLVLVPMITVAGE